MSWYCTMPISPLDDQLRAADVEVVAAAARAVQERPAGAVLAERQPKAGLLQAVEQRAVVFLRPVGEQPVRDLGHRQRHRGVDQVAVLERGPVAEVHAVVDLRARLDVDHQRRAALHHGDARAVAVQVLRDVVRAGAGAEHQHRPAAPGGTVGELARMQHRAAKRSSVGICGRCGVPLTLVAMTMCFGRSVRVLPSARRSRALPAPRTRVEGCALERGLRPEGDVHALGVGLEPVGDAGPSRDRPARSAGTACRAGGCCAPGCAASSRGSAAASCRRCAACGRRPARRCPAARGVRRAPGRRGRRRRSAPSGRAPRSPAPPLRRSSQFGP